MKPFGIITNESLVHPFCHALKGSVELEAMLKGVHFLDENTLPQPLPDGAVLDIIELTRPSAEWRFSHESAVAVHKGVIYACWFSNYVHEIQGFTPIFGRYSEDGGKTWSEPTIWIQDAENKTQITPPMFGEADGKLYLSVGIMTGNDNMQGMDWYVLDEDTKTFVLNRRIRDGIKLHNNVAHLPDGRIVCPIRVGPIGHAPLVNAVWISDSGKIDTDDWRIVRVGEGDKLPNGQVNVCPENTLMRIGNTLYMFVRNQAGEVPLLYISHDFGETWSELLSHDVDVRASKMAAGTLSDGRGYLFANVETWGRRVLRLFLTEPNDAQFTKQYTVFHYQHPHVADAYTAHYPSVWEDDGKLYVSATINYHEEGGDGDETGTDWEYRGMSLWILDIAKL